MSCQISEDLASDMSNGVTARGWFHEFEEENELCSEGFQYWDDEDVCRRAGIAGALLPKLMRGVHDRKYWQSRG